MAGNMRIPQAELTGVYGAVVKRISRKMFGEVPEPLGVVWHNRKVLNFSFAVSRRVKKWDRCDANLKSFAARSPTGNCRSGGPSPPTDAPGCGSRPPEATRLRRVLHCVPAQASKLAWVPRANGCREGAHDGGEMGLRRIAKE